ncbi:DEAD/DEAH box helicase [Paracoccus yeei]|uniref:DEAD/DEAH box helicase n=1 Tax=Paracoccus yeei TaxID=147645 RepID=A0A5P2QNV4_9RHOB|nr:DEAD/DEAH box helicase [Paracoccus yeei]QEU07420.1 DEAD/DEAH box helicase [Paracoccus yeei]
MTLAFDRLSRPVQKWIRAQGWTGLRPLQAEAIGAIMDGTADLVVTASTAGGKTEAAFLPLISQVLDDPQAGAGFDLLYLGPLKALITDQARRLDGICHETGLPVVPWHGDIAGSIKTRALKNPRGILLITPESLEALFIRRGNEIPGLFGALRAVVIDELHSVLDSERGVQMRSLLNRIESRLGRSLRRIGLSATLGDIGLACAYLRPGDPGAVGHIAATGGGSELRVQLRGHVAGGPDSDEPAAADLVAGHLFQRLRGSSNLVFAGSRERVEIYADKLRQLCDAAGLPQEFHAHHANLSREHRDFVERRLKDGRLPTTAICTSTLELGIDIGDVTCVAQIGAPFSVASLRQRLGRSGRRAGQPAILRQYVIEAWPRPDANLADRLRLDLVRAVAMIDLLIEGWCEPPAPQALHLSTLVHQILSVIAERGGTTAAGLHRLLCREGPFRSVDAALFQQVLRAIGHPDTGLIEQAGNSILLLGHRGEKLVEHYSFYAVFQTPEEYSLQNGAEKLGTLPVDNILAPGSLLIFSGRRWQVREIHAEARVIVVDPAKAGVAPDFAGSPGLIHDRVIQRMFHILGDRAVPVYLEPLAVALLEQARSSYSALGGDRIHELSPRAFLLMTRRGTVVSTTLALALQSVGFRVQPYDGVLEVLATDATPDLRAFLTGIARGASVDLFAHDPPLCFEKFHPFLTRPLLEQDASSSRVDLAALAGLCKELTD